MDEPDMPSTGDADAILGELNFIAWKLTVAPGLRADILYAMDAFATWTGADDPIPPDPGPNPFPDPGPPDPPPMPASPTATVGMLQWLQQEAGANGGRFTGPIYAYENWSSYGPFAT